MAGRSVEDLLADLLGDEDDDEEQVDGCADQIVTQFVEGDMNFHDSTECT